MFKKWHKEMCAMAIVVIFVVVFGIFYSWYCNRPADTIKVAVIEKDIKGTNYILCEPVDTTGFTWRVIKNEEGNVKNQLCNIIGILPKDDLKLNTEFLMANNVYVFYVIDFDEYYSEELQEQCVNYTVSGWDILVPVKHGRIDSFFESKKYITSKDV